MVLRLLLLLVLLESSLSFRSLRGQAPLLEAEKCALLPELRHTGQGGFHVLYESLHTFGRARNSHAAGFSCLPRDCDALDASDVTKGFQPAAKLCSAPLSGVRTACGPPFAGWPTVAVVMLLPSGSTLRELFRKELGRRGCDELTCVPGVFWNVSAFAAATLVLLADCADPPCVGEPADVIFLRSLGVNVVHDWTDPSVERADLWHKLRIVLNMARQALPDLQFVLKVDTDTILFPERMLDFLTTLATAAGTLQPLYFGTFAGTIERGVYFQGHAYGMNAVLLNRVLGEVWNNVSTTDEDYFMGELAGRVGAFYVHCGNFVSYAPSYLKPGGSTVYPLPTNPITMHKVHSLSHSRKRQITSGAVCRGAAWNCRNETTSFTWMHLKQLILR